LAKPKLIADENISWRIKRLLPDDLILPANEIPVANRKTDKFIWEFAKDNDMDILTFDEDFVELHNLYGHPPKIIWLRMGNVTTPEIAERLMQLAATIKDFTENEVAGVLEIY
jgi:predicted nuclease of predicted toxin-antitoxin system